MVRIKITYSITTTFIGRTKTTSIYTMVRGTGVPTKHVRIVYFEKSCPLAHMEFSPNFIFFCNASPCGFCKNHFLHIDIEHVTLSYGIFLGLLLCTIYKNTATRIFCVKFSYKTVSEINKIVSKFRAWLQSTT